MGPLSINVGIIDRLLRVILGIILLSIVFAGPRTAWGWLGLIPLITGAIGYCPLYVPFRFTTCGTPHRIPKHA